MIQRSLRQVLLSGIVLSMVALSACATESGSSVGLQASGTADAPATAVAPTTAVMPPGSVVSPRAAHATSGARASSASRTSSAVAHPGVGIPAAALSGSTLYGFSAPELALLSQSEKAAQVQAMKAMGVNSVRLEANWYGMQLNGPSDSNWAPFDEEVAAVQAAGLSVEIVIDGCASWAASGAPGNADAGPTSPAQFAAFVRMVASKYGAQGVKYFEIGNEPNIQRFWEPKPDPAAYTADLVAAYAAIKAVDPSAVVLSGGLSPATDTSTSYDPRTFLADMYADGAAGNFDGLGDHPYSYPLSPADVNDGSGWSQMYQTSPSLRSIMIANGDSAKKIWITEYGAPTSGAASVGAAGQSTDLVEAISQVKQFSWVGSFYIYTWADLSQLASLDNGFGLLNTDNSQKPAYAAVATALRG